jgi:hypothetical protein
MQQQQRRSPALDRLDQLVGEWELEAIVEGRTVVTGRTTFEWLEGGAFLVQRADGEPAPGSPPEWVAGSPFPTTAIVGLDDTAERFWMLYADARGVSRVYELSLRESVLKIWRDAPGFFQRFTGTFADDGATIVGRWERSDDGSSWEKDFDLTYTRVS